MTILNVVVDDSRAIVVLDSMCRSTSGPNFKTALVTKFFILAHCQAVLACRGSYLHSMTQFVNFNSQGRTFDELVANMIDIVSGGYTNFANVALSNEANPEYLNGQEIALVGWSARSQRMELHVVCQESGSNRFTMRKDQGHFLAPHVDAMAPVESPHDLEAMKLLVQAQHDLHKQNGAEGFTGGLVFCVTLTQHDVRIERILDLA